VTNGKVYHGFHDDKKVEEHCCSKWRDCFPRKATKTTVLQNL